MGDDLLILFEAKDDWGAEMGRSGPTRKTIRATKAEETTAEAWRLINAEKLKREARTVKLRALREAREAAEAAKKTKPKKRKPSSK